MKISFHLEKQVIVKEINNKIIFDDVREVLSKEWHLRGTRWMSRPALQRTGGEWRVESAVESAMGGS